MNDFYEEGMQMAWIAPVLIGIIVLLALCFPDKATEILTKMAK